MIPRSEYPRPQLEREDWLCLNGEWEFEIDNQMSGKERKLFEKEKLEKKIIVPFCPESKLSGIGNTDFMNAVWYKRKVVMPEGWKNDGRRTILHIGACDYKTEVWVNGNWAGVHIGGYISFSFDITEHLCDGENTIVIYAEDELRSRTQPAGKQSDKLGSYGCSYTRTTGIWQTVWLENVPAAYIASVKYVTDIRQQMLFITAECKNAYGLEIEAVASYENEEVGKAKAVVGAKEITLAVKLDRLELWEAGNGRLYDLTLRLGDDTVKSYFGMREVSCLNGMMKINGKAVFQRLILDQGFYPDGIYTAPTDDELKADITRSMDMGFNGARLHEKIFEPRFLYHCDKLGYLVWGEHANWVLDISKSEGWKGFIPEWLEEIKRDCCHPSIIGWCPFNETQKNQDDYLLKFIVDLTNAVDGTRPVIDTSGWEHVLWSGTDIIDAHDYEQDVEKFTEHFAPLAKGEKIEFNNSPGKVYTTFVSEYGGILWKETVDDNAWGYGNAPKTREEFIERYRGLTLSLLENPALTAFCYTQLTDVEQEQNGLYTYDRRAKFDPKIISEINKTKAAIEE